MGAKGAGRQKPGAGRLLCGVAAIASLAGAQTPDLQAVLGSAQAAGGGAKQETNSAGSAAASESVVRDVLQRLDRLEAQNQELMMEIRALREQLAAGATTGATTAAAPAAQSAAQPPAPSTVESATPGATGTPGGE